MRIKRSLAGPRLLSPRAADTFDLQTVCYTSGLTVMYQGSIFWVTTDPFLDLLRSVTETSLQPNSLDVERCLVMPLFTRCQLCVL